MSKGFDDTIDWYNKNANAYAHTLSGRSRFENIDLFLSFLPKGSKILDAGCAGGRDTNVIHQKGYDVTGLDLSKGLIEVAKETYPEIPFVEGDFLTLPFDNKTFDGVWAHASLVHLPTPEDAKGAIREFSRILKPQGILYLYVKAQLGKEKTAMVTDGFSDTPRFFQYYTQEELNTILEKTGFTVLKNEKQDDLGGRKGVEWILILARKM